MPQAVREFLIAWILERDGRLVAPAVFKTVVDK